MPDSAVIPLEVQDRAGYRVIRQRWYSAGIDNYTNPPVQNEDLMVQLLNVLPPLQGTLNRRWGYTTFSPKLDTGSGDHI